MKKQEDMNPGGVNGMGAEKWDVTSDDFVMLRNKIAEASQKQTRAQILENKVLAIKLRILSYLHEASEEEIREAGDFLKELLDVLDIKHNRFAEYIHLHPANLSALLAGRRKMNSQLAIKLGDIFHISPDLWMKIQTQNDLTQTLIMSKEEKGKYRLEDLIEI